MSLLGEGFGEKVHLAGDGPIKEAGPSSPPRFTLFDLQCHYCQLLPGASKGTAQHGPDASCHTLPPLASS